MSRRTRRAAALAAVILGGCTWAGDRARDAAQIVSLDAGHGYGLAVDATATDLAQLGFGVGRTWKAGLWDGVPGAWQEVLLHAPAGFFFGPTDPGPT